MSSPALAPQPGTVYRTPDGRPLIYVRTEDRPGRGGPEHLFVGARDRVSVQRWESAVPSEYELVLDTEGRVQANEEQWLRHAAEHDIEILLGLLRKACGWLPRERAQELRAEYLSTRP